jgi:hypothetical protein
MTPEMCHQVLLDTWNRLHSHTKLKVIKTAWLIKAFRKTGCDPETILLTCGTNAIGRVTARSRSARDIRDWIAKMERG